MTAGWAAAGKWLFIVVMWMGRVEIIGVLILVMGIVRGFEPR
jgi:Trk-type K+ transport system membrane component